RSGPRRRQVRQGSNPDQRGWSSPCYRLHHGPRVTEPPAGVEPAPRPYKGRVLAVHTTEAYEVRVAGRVRTGAGGAHNPGCFRLHHGHHVDNYAPQAPVAPHAGLLQKKSLVSEFVTIPF